MPHRFTFSALPKPYLEHKLLICAVKFTSFFCNSPYYGLHWWVEMAQLSLCDPGMENQQHDDIDYHT